MLYSLEMVYLLEMFHLFAMLYSLLGLTAEQLLCQSHEETVLTVRQPLPQSYPEICKKDKAIYLILMELMSL